jgi:1-acyl-sn-glycerol-3-phosphate acyltransferase
MWYILNSLQLLALGIFNLIFLPIVIIVGLISQKAMQWMAMKIWSPIMLAIPGGTSKVYGKENIDAERPCIYIANHSSHFDIPALYVVFPFFLYFIAKQELQKVPMFGWANTLVGTIWINRKDRSKAMATMESAGRDIKNGKNVISFPEGTRSKTGEIGTFKKGTFALAQTCEVDIVPIYIHGTRPLNKPGTIWMRPSRVKIVIGERMEFKDFQKHSPEEFANHAQRVITNLAHQIT